MISPEVGSSCTAFGDTVNRCELRGISKEEEGSSMITVACGVRDRLDHLRESLPTWLACKEVSQVLLVDWSSREPLALPDDVRVDLVRVEGQTRWHHSKCHNQEVELAGCERILRLDADHVLSPSFFTRHYLEEGELFRYAITPSSDENEKHLAGAVYARRDDFLRVGGYNERLVHYGYEDEDLVRRLVASGLRARDLDPAFMRHIPHGDDARLAGQDVPADLGARPPWAPWSWRPGRAVDDLADRNKHLAAGQPWSIHEKKSQWLLSATGPRSYTCREVA